MARCWKSCAAAFTVVTDFVGPKGIPKLPTIESWRQNATVYLLMLVIMRFTSSFITPTVGALGEERLHGACWPDIVLHVVFKGIVEKNLSWSLALVYGLPRIIGADWTDSMATLNDRVALLTPVVNFHGIR